MKGYFFSSLLLVSSLVFTVTENKDKPIKGEWDLQLKKIWEKKEAGIDSFAEVGQITSDSDGCLFVADSKYFKIFVFDQNGKFIRAFGKKGEGPGELKRLGGFHLFADQLVFFQAYKFHYFKKDGSYVKSTPIPWRFLLIDFISHNKCLGIVSKEQDKGRYKKQIIIFDIKNKNQNVIKEEPVPITGRGATERMQFNIMIPGLSPSLITYLKDDRIFYGVNNAYRIKVMDLKGTLLQDIVLKRNKTKMSLKEMEKILPEGLKKFPGIKNALLKL